MIKNFLIAVGVILVLLLVASAIQLLNAEKEAAAVVVGIIFGVAAGIPTSVLTLVILSRREQARLEEVDQHRQATQSPPVIVIQGQPQALPPGPQAGYWPPALPDNQRGVRIFHVVGADGQNWEDY